MVGRACFASSQFLNSYDAPAHCFDASGVLQHKGQIDRSRAATSVRQRLLLQQRLAANVSQRKLLLAAFKWNCRYARNLTRRFAIELQRRTYTWQFTLDQKSGKSPVHRAPRAYALH